MRQYSSMVKVLLVFEDFNELTLTETYLKKVGFDVVGITNEARLSDQILSFNPEVIVAFGKNSRVSSFSVGQKMKENQRYHGKVVIVVPKDVRPAPQEIIRMKMDGILEAPIDPEKLVQVLARMAGQSAAGYLDKLNKARFTDPEIASRMVSSNPSATGAAAPASSGAGTSTASPLPPESESNVFPLHRGRGISFQDPERARKYAEMVKDVQFDLQQSTHQRKDIKEKQRELKKGWDFESLEELDDLKRQFVEALFRKR